MDANEQRKKTKKIDTINKIKNSAAKKSAKITAKKIVEKYKSMKRPKKTYLVSGKDLKTIDYNEPQEDLFKGESIAEAANKVLHFQAFKKDQAKALNDLKENSKKSAAITAKKISQKYKSLKKTKKTFLVNEEDFETIAYDDDPQEDLFRRESILEAANRVLDFEAFKKQQKEAINNFNEKLLKNAETINYVDDINLDDVKDNKNLKISAKKISDKYKKLRKRKAEEREKKINEIIVEFKLPKKKKTATNRQSGIASS